MAEDLKVTLGLDSSAYTAEMARVKAETKAWMDGIAPGVQAAGEKIDGVASGPVAGLKDAIGGVGGASLMMAAVVMTAVAAAAVAIKKAISATVEMTDAAVKNAQALGIGVTQAGALDAAMKKLGSSGDAYVGVSEKLAQEIRTHEDKVNALGIATRNADGSFRNLNDVMTDSIRVVNGYKEGTDRTMAAQVAFGSVSKDVEAVLRLQATAVAEATARQEALGLVIGVESVQAASQYHAAMGDLGMVFDGLKKTIGDAFMPVVTKLAEWLSSIGPAAITVLRGALGGILSVFWGLYTAVGIVVQSLMGMGEVLLILSDRWLDFITKLAHGDFSGAADAFDGMGAQMGEAWGARMENIVAITRKAHDEIIDLFTTDTPAKKMAAAGGGNDYKPPEKAEKLTPFVMTLKRKPAKDDKAWLEENIDFNRQAAMMAVDFAQQAADQEADLGIISHSQQIADYQQFEEQRHNITAEALDKRLALAKEDSAEQKRIYDDIALEQEAHVMRAEQLSEQAALAAKTPMLNAINTLSSQWTRGLTMMMKGQLTFANAVKGLWQTITDSIIGMFAKMVVDWIRKQIVMLIFHKATALSKIATSAGEAGAAGVASFAGAPWPIDLGAPAFGAAMFAAAMAYAPAAAAAGGFDVPAGTNPVTQLHAKEMVLPAQLAERVRSMTPDEGQGGGQGTTHHWNISTMDARSFDQSLRANSSSLRRNIERVLREANYGPMVRA